jgi:hypothetical protein
MRSGRFVGPATAGLGPGPERLPVRIAVLIITAASVLAWAILIGIGAVLLEL